MSKAPSRMIYQTDETRERILVGAQRLFVEKGYNEAQMKDIAETVGISRHSLYRYYRDKLDLGFAVQTRVLSGLMDLITQLFAELEKNEELNARQLLIKGTIEIYSTKETELDFRFLAEFDAYNSGARLPENFVSRLPLSSFKKNLNYFYGLARRGVEEGSIRADTPSKHLVRVVLYTNQAIAYRLLMRGEALYDTTTSDRHNFLSTLADILEDGLRPR